MRPIPLLALLVASSVLAGCGRTTDIANLDSVALVRAIEAANASPGPDVLRLAPHGLYTLRTAANERVLLPPVRGELRIEGNGAEIRGYLDGPRALLEVEGGADVRIDHLALAEGSDGAIRNFGTLRLDTVRIIDSTGAGGTSAIVLNHGLLEARDTEIAYNVLPTSRRDAGTVLNYGQLRLRGASIHDNVAQARFASLAVAGAVLNLGTMQAQATRIADNEADDADGVDDLAFAAVLNVGNGVVEGDLAPALVRDAGRSGLLASQ